MTLIRHSLFDNFPCLTCPNNVSLINSQIFSFGTRWLNIQNKEENNDKKVARIFAPCPAFLSLSVCLSVCLKFSQEHVFSTLWPILVHASLGKLN